MNIPIGFQTDVNAAALGELQHGGHGSIHTCVYVTVGTGIGGGVIVNGACVSGALHPECGHIRVPRHPSDTYKGNCPFHSDCLEGLANAQALSDRVSIPPSELHTLSDNHEIFEFEAYYLAQLCATLAMIVSPQVIVLGGGVLKRSSLYKRIQTLFVENVNGYINVPLMNSTPDKYIVASKFDVEGSNTSSGCVGVLELARRTLEETKSKGQ